MAEVVVKTRAVLDPGEHVFGPVQLPVDITKVGVAFDRFPSATWPVGPVFSFFLEWSPDGSAWEHLCSVTNGAVSDSNDPVTAAFQKGVGVLPAGSWARARAQVLQAIDCRVRVTWQ